MLDDLVFINKIENIIRPGNEHKSYRVCAFADEIIEGMETRISDALVRFDYEVYELPRNRRQRMLAKIRDFAQVYGGNADTLKQYAQPVQPS